MIPYPPRAMTRSLRMAVLLALAGSLACAPEPWDADRFERRHPALAAISHHRLIDATPYLLPAGGSIAFFLCRWPSGATIPVSLPPDASEQERRGLEAVMRAWEGAGLGVRFAAGAPTGAGIELHLVDPEAGIEETAFAANTIADCAVAPEAAEDREANVLPARLVFASIYLWRGGFDALGRPVPHSPAEFVGSALHEFGHALGFQGHVRLGRSIMLEETDAVRRAGQRLLAGKAFGDPTLRALYAVPSGSVVGRVSVDAQRTEPVDRMLRIARERGFAGPTVRVGDLDGRIAWRDAEGATYALRIFDVRRLLRAPESLSLQTTIATARILAPY
jgi:hypothetical protein